MDDQSTSALYGADLPDMTDPNVGVPVLPGISGMTWGEVPGAVGSAVASALGLPNWQTLALFGGGIAFLILITRR